MLTETDYASSVTDRAIPSASQAAIPDELAKLDDVLNVVTARVSQLEDKLGPVRNSMGIAGGNVDGPLPPCSPVAESLRAIRSRVEHLVGRLDSMLTDVEL